MVSFLSICIETHPLGISLKKTCVVHNHKAAVLLAYVTSARARLFEPSSKSQWEINDESYTPLKANMEAKDCWFESL